MLHQSAQAKRLTPVPTPFTAGAVCTAIFSISFASTAYTAADDLIELAGLPADCRPVAATLIGAGVGALTADVGFLSEPLGDNTDESTSGDEIFDGASVDDTEVDATAASMVAIAPTSGNRAIGMTLSGNVAAGAGKAVTLVLTYIAA
jgi:hypothetical protein